MCPQSLYHSTPFSFCHRNNILLLLHLSSFCYLAILCLLSRFCSVVGVNFVADILYVLKLVRFVAKGDNCDMYKYRIASKFKMHLDAGVVCVSKLPLGNSLPHLPARRGGGIVHNHFRCFLSHCIKQS